MARQAARTPTSSQPAVAPGSRVMLAATLLCAMAVALTACGQTGALYFDEAPPADQLPPSKKTSQPSAVPQLESTNPQEKGSE